MRAELGLGKEAFFLLILQPNSVPHSPPVGGPKINNDDRKMLVLMLAFSWMTLLILPFILQDEALESGCSMYNYDVTR
jgi:hypothetical protein